MFRDSYLKMVTQSVQDLCLTLVAFSFSCPVSRTPYGVLPGSEEVKNLFKRSSSQYRKGFGIATLKLESSQYRNYV